MVIKSKNFGPIVKTIFLFACTTLAAACNQPAAPSNDASQGNSTATLASLSTISQHAGYDYQKFHWDTTGGGDLHFDIIPVSATAFEVTNISYQFHQGTHAPIVITSGSSGQLFSLMLSVFTRNCQFMAEPPSTLPTGSWHSVSMTDLTGYTQQYSNAILAGNPAECNMDLIYPFVSQYLPPI